MLTLCDGQLTVPTSNCTLCGYGWNIIQHYLFVYQT
jgi:hypothetical protein